MIRLGLRLTLNGGREAAARLAVIVVAVAIGAALLLVTLAGMNAVDAQNQRYSWLQTGVVPEPSPAPTGADGSQPDPLWWALRRDSFDGKDIGRVDVAAAGPDAPVPPGLAALPGPGEFYASPALAELLAATPSDQLGDRYGGTLAGTIGDAGLPAPGSLLVVVGHDADELAADPHATRVTSISTTSPGDCRTGCVPGLGIDAQGITLVLGVVAVALLFPVLIFIGAATRLSAARREQRFAAMRLVGATPRQVAVLAAVESSVAAAIGVAVGFGLFLALRPSITAVPFTGEPFFAGDLALGVSDALLVAVGVPVGAAVAARLALRRVRRSPLGVERRATPAPPRARRVALLAAGLAELGWFAVAGRPATTGGQLAAYLPGLLAVTAGLVVAGPWLTMLGSRLMVRRAGRAAGLLAGRRLADDPHGGFRAVSGLVLALFVGSAAVGTITTVVGASQPGVADGGTVVQQFYDPLGGRPTAVPSDTLAELTAIPGVAGVTALHVPPGEVDPTVPPGAAGPPLASCAQLARTPTLGRCPDGAEVVSVESRFGGSVIEGATSLADVVWPAADVAAGELERLPIDTVVVGTDGSTAAVERARTLLGNAFPQRFSPETVGEINAHGTRDLPRFRQLANVVVGASLAIAGCSLAVGVAGGLADRRRPFSLLRLTGVPLALLRRVVALEAVVPLLSTAVVAAGTGFLTAQLFASAQLERSLRPPGADYYLVVAAGLAASLAVIASTLPLLDRLTGPEAARND